MTECKTEELKLSTRFASINNLEREDLTPEMSTRNNCTLISAESCRDTTQPAMENV